MTKEELLQEIEELKKKVEEMEEEDMVFNPYPIKKEDGYYYEIDKYGLIDKLENYTTSSEHIYNAFNSEEYAELRRRETDLQDRMWAFSYENGWKDEYLFDENQHKHYLGYHTTDDRVIILNNYPCLSVNVYFVSRKVAEKAKEIFEYEIKELWEMRANITKGV